MEPSLLKYRQERRKRGNGMISDGFFIMSLGALGFLLLFERLCAELGPLWKRRVILRRHEHTEKIMFTLGEGQTIIGVKEEQNKLCFYVANQTKDGKEYE
jgi:hypothetical protein